MLRLRKRTAAPEAKRSGPVDRWLDLPDDGLEIARVIEGACAHFHGVPLDACPWPRNYPEHWQGWRRGWLGAALYRDAWEQDDSSRWLRETTTTATD